MPVFHFSAGISHHTGGVYKHGVKMQESSKECSAVSGTGCSSPPEMQKTVIIMNKQQTDADFKNSKMQNTVIFACKSVEYL